ncbi:MAG: S4 domain-containing protein [Culicoidibacterales bacterium]
MRIDKFLKDSRLVKRRTIAKQMCEAKKIVVNGKIVKPGYEVQVEDKLVVEYAKMFLTVEIVSLKIALNKATASECYSEISREMK